MAYSDEVLADNPRLYHRFEGNIANSGAYSVSPVSNDISFVPSPLGQAVKMNSLDGYVQYPLTFSPFGNQWTIEGWFRVSTAKEYNNIARVSHADGSRHIGLRVRGSSHEPQNRPNVVELFTYDSFSWGDVQTTINVNDGKWHHVVVKAEGTATVKSLRMFLDGVDVSTGGAMQTRAISGLGGQLFKIGAGPDPGGVEAMTDGALDEVAVYDYALSDARIVAHFNAYDPVVRAISGAAGRLTLRNTSAAIELGAAPLIVTSNSAAVLRFDGSNGPTLVLGPKPPVILSTGITGRLNLRSLAGTPKIRVTSVSGTAGRLNLHGLNVAVHVSERSTKAVSSGQPARLRLSGTSATIRLSEAQILGRWYMQVFMRSGNFDTSMLAADATAVMTKKNFKTHLEYLVRI